jgi:hypothetical protein
LQCNAHKDIGQNIHAAKEQVMNAANIAPRALSPDEVELFKKQRELALPAARIASYDEFAKWLFTIITVVGTLGAAFSNAAFKKLNGYGAVFFFLAIATTGVSLALAIILRSVEPGDANWYNLDDMLQKATAALKIKRTLAWAAGVLFATAIVLAGISPFASGDQSKDSTVTGRALSYSYGKDGIHVTAALPRRAQTVGEIRVSAMLPKDESLIAAQRVVVDQQGIMRLDISSASIPATSTVIKISLICDSKDSNKKQEFLLSLHPPDDKLIPSVSSNQCFE